MKVKYLSLEPFHAQVFEEGSFSPYNNKVMKTKKNYAGTRLTDNFVFTGDISST